MKLSISKRIEFVGKVEMSQAFFSAFGDIYFGQEFREATMVIEEVAYFGDYDFGKNYWDRFIFQFVPGQLIGFDIKNELMTGRPQSLDSKLGYVRLSDGITPTGMADAFGSFGYFGFIIFFLIGRYVSRWWLAAQNGGIGSQIVLLLLLPKALLAITHVTPVFFLHFITLGIFLVPFLYLSKR
jgi:hypothetical protein